MNFLSLPKVKTGGIVGAMVGCVRLHLGHVACDRRAHSSLVGTDVMTRTLILPGFMGSGPGHWQRHWLTENPGSQMVEQDDWHEPRRDAWLSRLESVLENQDDVILVAHSLGCLLAADLAGRRVAEKIRGALLVAPCHLARTEVIHPNQIYFGSMPEQRLPFPSLVVSSLDDPYMRFDECRYYASAWGSDLIDLGYAGHINVAAGFGRWAHGYRLAALLQNRKPEKQVGATSIVGSHRPFRGLVREKRLLS